MIGGVPHATATEQLLQKAGISIQNAELVNNSISIFGTLGAGVAIRTNQAVARNKFISTMNNVFRSHILPTRQSETFTQSINPYHVRFSQNSISGKFRNGTTIDDLSLALKKGTIDPKIVEPIRLVQRNNLYFSLDNRRLEAFRRAGIEVPYRMATPEEIISETWKLQQRMKGLQFV